MSTTVTPVNLTGQKLATGDNRALHRDLYKTEVMAKFEDKLVTKDRVTNYTISSGKSWTFPVVGGASGLVRHLPGQAPTPRQIKRDEIRIDIDDRIVHTIYQDELDEKLADVNLRSHFTTAQAYALANAMDANMFRMMVKAARHAGLIAGEMPGGSTLVDAGFRTNSAALVKGLFDAATELQSKNVDLSEASAFLTPAQHSLLVQSKDVLNKDWGGEGSYAKNSVAMVAGIPLVITNNLPTQDLSSDATITAAGLNPETVFNRYRGDYSNLAGVVSTKQAVGVVTAVPLETRFTSVSENYGEFIQTSYVYGAGVLRPECAVELSVA